MNQELMKIHEQAMEKLKPVFRGNGRYFLKNTQKVLKLSESTSCLFSTLPHLMDMVMMTQDGKSWKKYGLMYSMRKQPW